VREFFFLFLFNDVGAIFIYSLTETFNPLASSLSAEHSGPEPARKPAPRRKHRAKLNGETKTVTVVPLVGRWGTFDIASRPSSAANSAANSTANSTANSVCGMSV
jgi:hypothetical protein